MTNTLNTRYPHRRNGDGSFDSICTACFATIGRAKDESRLAEQERNHSCRRSPLSDWDFNHVKTAAQYGSAHYAA